MNADTYYNLAIENPDAASTALDAWLARIRQDIIDSMTEPQSSPLATSIDPDPEKPRPLVS